MTLPVQESFNQSTANGVTKVFPYSFKVFAASHLVVQVAGVTVTTGFTVSGVGVEAGGNVTFTAAPANGAEVLIYRDIPLERSIAYVTNGPFPAATVNKDVDLLWQVLQELAAEQAGVLRVPFPGAVDDLPAAADRLDRVLFFDPSTGAPGVSTFTATEIASTIAAAYAGTAGPLDALTFIQSGAGAATRTAQAKARETVSVTDFGATGDGSTNDSTAFINAAATGRRVYIPAGTYRINFSGLPNNTHFYGEGDRSVIKPYDVTARYAIQCDSGSASAHITDVSFSKLKFLGTVATDGFSEQCHLLDLHGVKRLRIDSCYFEGARGDGFYLGGGLTSLQERHNVDVMITNCVFDGVNNDNRNGLSVIDIDGIVVEGCTFKNWSKSTMPGSIDFEPNYSFSVIKNVRVAKNAFSACNGNRAHVTFSVENTANSNVSNLIVIGNTFDGNEAVNVYSATTLPSLPIGLIIANNIATGVDFFFQKVTGGWYGLTIANNIISGTGSGQGRINIGNGTGTYTVRDVALTGNQITSNTTVPISITDSSENVRISGNVMRGATQAHIVIGAGSSASSYWVITENIFLGSPTRTVQHDSATHNAVTNTFKNNVSPVGVTHNFRALNTDDCGQISNAITATSVPNLWPYGLTRIRASANLGISGGTDVGMLENHRHSSVAETMTYQVFTPQYDATYKKRFYLRKATAATTWDSWYLFEGT